MTSYEANIEVAHSLVRSGKYIKIAEARAGEFAGKVISNLLLLGHARVGDLVRAYRGGQFKSTHDRLLAVSCESPSKLRSRSSDRSEEKNEENAALQSIHEILSDLLQNELVSRVHVSHFHSDADNRSEAEKVVPHPEEYKAKSKRERDAQHEVAVIRKLKEWKYCTDGGHYEVGGSKAERKRIHQDRDSQRPKKCQRLDSPLGQEGMGVTGKLNRPMLREPDCLDVCRIEYVKKWLKY